MLVAGSDTVSFIYMYPQMIDQNWKYNRETALPAFGDGSMELIPTVGPGWNKLIQDGRGAIGNSPIVKRDPATYRTICNVAKMNAGRNRLIFIDSYNKYNFDSFIEPTVEGYGNGYGKTYLQITREPSEDCRLANCGRSSRTSSMATFSASKTGTGLNIATSLWKD